MRFVECCDSLEEWIGLRQVIAQILMCFSSSAR